MSSMRSYFVLALQLIGTFTILFLVQDTALQTVLFLTLWAVTFYPLTKAELILFTLACVVYTIADLVVIQYGVFHFTHSDIGLLPYYEPFMWGFYFLHAKRLLGNASIVWYVGYLTVLGIAIEFTGTTLALWSYDIPYYVAWWIGSWAASGAILATICIPLSDWVARKTSARPALTAVGS